MSTPEEMREDAKRDAAYEREERMKPDGPCPNCGAEDWAFSGSEPAYGADADGRRGIHLAEWECRACGQLITVTWDW
jgi:ssDNA-binding Zn-finger/Zn-ribbon topoisomerase 1